ncbi:hypothetical protein [Mycolicibacterium pallens]|uniref:DUF3618 domain-containing protein n=1 Tax=Mycolicibacterium pallens TaxID=370524 RepID=A0ABX8VQD2_9MYCO|nr:hypothetical protein [Mycolicibacterium pallens]QYL17990.1 hypothetical protein K0O64_05410 [Mycolicibacterium pallens]
MTNSPNLSAGGQDAIDKLTEKFQADLLQEADRFESAARASGAAQEITAQHLHQADLVIRQALLPRKRKKADIFLALGSPGGAAVAGYACSNLDKGWGPIAVVIATVITLGCEAIRFVRGQ